MAQVVVTKGEMLAERFESAADLIERRGWTQGLMRDFNGYCVMGAVHVSGPVGQQYADALRVLGCQLGTVDIAGWNDHPKREEQEVLDLLRRCAKVVLTDE